MSMEETTRNAFSRDEHIDPAVADLDEEYLEATFGDDTDFLREVLETFVQSSERLYSEVQQAISAEDIAGVRTAAHTLKGSSRMIGANLFAFYCQDVETGETPAIFMFSKRMLISLGLLLEECRRRLTDL